MVGIDRDPALLEKAEKRFTGEKRFHPVHANFASIEKVSGKFTKKYDGVLFDLGMSSFQLEEEDRGFSFLRDEPLDMRFDPYKGFSAENALHSWDEKKLRDVISTYGEERHAGRIARTIVTERTKKPIHTTFDLVRAIEKAVPKRFRLRRIHPATKTFQALRIAVNDELHALENGLEGAWRILNDGGRIVVISFHSLEDRIVKHAFRTWKQQQNAEVLTKKPIVPGKGETAENPRARSAKLRAIQK